MQTVCQPSCLIHLHCQHSLSTYVGVGQQLDTEKTWMRTYASFNYGKQQRESMRATQASLHNMQWSVIVCQDTYTQVCTVDRNLRNDLSNGFEFFLKRTMRRQRSCGQQETCRLATFLSILHAERRETSVRQNSFGFGQKNNNRHIKRNQKDIIIIILSENNQHL